MPRGLTLAADVGVPNDASGWGTTYSASAGIGWRSLGVTATFARVSVPGEDARRSTGIAVSMRLIGGPLVPFSAAIQGSVASGWKRGTTIEGADITTTPYSAGLGMAWTIASPVVSLKPWLAPRLQWTAHGAGTYGGPATRDAAISGGIDLGFINGVTVRGMYDRVLNDGTDASVWSVGMGYSLRIGR